MPRHAPTDNRRPMTEREYPTARLKLRLDGVDVLELKIEPSAARAFARAWRRCMRAHGVSHDRDAIELLTAVLELESASLGMED